MKLVLVDLPRTAFFRHWDQILTGKGTLFAEFLLKKRQMEEIVIWKFPEETTYLAEICSSNQLTLREASKLQQVLIQTFTQFEEKFRTAIKELKETVTLSLGIRSQANLDAVID